MAAYKILLIDDDPSLLRSIGLYFEKLGHHVDRAESGEDGLAAYERARPDVTILDYSMPGVSGLEVLESLRARQATVIMLTGKGQVDTAVEAMRMGAENFLVKPVDLSHLGVAVEKAVEKSLLRQENVVLQERLNPTIRRRLLRFGLLVLMIALSASVGMLIGGSGEEDRPRNPIPIPVDSVR
jgi:two-component system response regulator HydG